MNGKQHTPAAGNRSRPRVILLLAALLCLGLSASDIPSAARKTVRTPPPYSGLMVRPPEVKPVRDSARKHFVPAIPFAANMPFRRPPVELFPFENPSAEARITPSKVEQTIAVTSPEEPGFSTTAREEAIAPPISRQPDNRISLKEEMVSLDDLDIGKYGGMVVPGAGGERDLQGFLRIPTVWGTQLQVPDILKPAVSKLVEGVNRYSEMRAEASSHLYLSSKQIFRMPFLLITTDTAFELTPIERSNFAEYLKKGGFAFLDNGAPQYENGAAEVSLHQMVKDALGSRAHFEPLSVSHPLYHCWFDFSDGPPRGAENEQMMSTDTVMSCGGSSRANSMNGPVFYLEGIFLDGHMVGVYSDKGYSVKWSRITDNIPQLKMGVNLVVYALTREGGMNRRNMEAYSDIP